MWFAILPILSPDLSSSPPAILGHRHRRHADKQAERRFERGCDSSHGVMSSPSWTVLHFLFQCARKRTARIRSSFKDKQFVRSGSAEWDNALSLPPCGGSLRVRIHDCDTLFGC